MISESLRFSRPFFDVGLQPFVTTRNFSSHMQVACRQLSTSNPLCNRNVEVYQTPHLPRSKMITPNDYAVCFTHDAVLSHTSDTPFLVPVGALFYDQSQVSEKDYIFLGESQGKRIFALSVPEPVPHFQAVPARDALRISDEATCQLICQGKQLLHWHQTSQYSGCCGVPTCLSEKEIAKVCQCCKKILYPTTFPVVMVMIERGKEILLARSPHFAPGMYSTLAGFVSAGESCEAAIHREVAEEVGIQVKDITYFKSQSWPFPSSLMLGYRAQYAGGEISIDNVEIEDARWFDAANLPHLPHECSLSRHLIEDYRQNQARKFV